MAPFLDASTDRSEPNGQTSWSDNPEGAAEPIAICGMALRLPGGIATPEQFWDFLIGKKDARGPIPETRFNADSYYSKSGKPGHIKTRHGYFLDGSVDLAALDTTFFRMPRNEVERADPQQRLLLELTRECLESAGETGWRGGTVGTFVGTFGEDWLETLTRDAEVVGQYKITGYGDFMLSNRLAYEYDLRGPSLTIKTGCSSALIGLHEACMAIQQGQCEAAVVAGSNLITAPGLFVSMSEQGVLSPGGSCRTFDAAADGYARGEAVNVVYIKRLSAALRDGNPVRAVLRGTASNADGSTPSLTTPSFESHEAMIRRAYAAAGVPGPAIAETGFVECHGTGTAAGDPIETAAVASAFGGAGVHIGSCKPNIGHSEGASGITSLIKAVLALEHRTIPPNIKFDVPNPRIPFARNKLVVPVEPTPWPAGRAERASVNSFGIGGANVHCVVESAASFLGTPPSPVSEPSAASTTTTTKSARLMVYSANTADSLRRQVVNNKSYVREHPGSLDDVAYTLSCRRTHLPHRAFSVVEDGAELSTSPFAKAPPSPADLVLVFTGQGAQWAQMGAELLRSSPAFARSIAQTDKALHLLPDGPSWTVTEELLRPAESSNLHKAYLSQPVCTAVQVALVDALRDAAGVEPFAVVGHSSGEMAAAYASGRLTAREVIVAAYYRGVVSGDVTRPGAMAAVGMGRAATWPFLKTGVVIACENSPSSVTISGDAHLVEEVLADIRHGNPGVLARLLKVERAYHSHHMLEVGEKYLSLTSPHMDDSTARDASAVSFYSSVTGEKLAPQDPTGAKYWRSNLESPVLFNSAVANLAKDHRSQRSNKLMFLEVGPHSALGGPVRQILSKEAVDHSCESCLIRSKNATETFLTALGQIWQHGVSVRLDGLANRDGTARVVPDLPSYPWQHDHSLLFSSRVSDAWRLRRFPKHELLGVRVPESSGGEPAFRNVLALDRVPWVRDHNVKGDVIFPCAGYVGMAGEAARQLHDGAGGYAGFAMRNVAIDMAMVLQENRSTEIVTSLRRERLTDSLDGAWWDFTIASHNGSSWLKHCSGQVKALDEDSTSREAKPASELSRAVGPGKWYQALRDVGANYGPCFQGLANVACSPTAHRSGGTARHTVDDDESHYAVHPTKVDFFLQLFSVAAARGVGHALDKMNVPTSIEALEIRDCGCEIRMEVETERTPRGLICGGGEGVGENGQVVLALAGVKLSPLEGDASEEDPDPHAGARVFWQPDVDFLRLSDLVRPHPEQGTLLRSQELTRNCIQWALQRLEGVETASPHLERFRGWMKKQPPPSKVLDAATAFEDASSFGPFSPFAVAIKQVLDNIVPVFRGEAEPLGVLMPNDVLTDVYNSLNITDRRSLFQSLGHSRPNLRILEIGAGTGGTTNKVLEWLRGPTGALLYSEYTYTDISAGFFSAAKDRFRDYPRMSFKALDISRDPVEQGFEPGSYDLVLAANVLHATPSLQATLANVHQLLCPEGRLYMEELSHDALPLNFVMGVLPGWWLGAEDGRPDQPHVTPERWDAELREAGFDGLEDVAQDAGRPNNLLNFMTARSAREKTAVGTITVLHDAGSIDIAAEVQTELKRNDLQATLHDVSQGPPPTTCDVIATLDLGAPFFEDVTPEDLATFQALVSEASGAGAGVLWLTRPSQLRCSDPRWGQTVGTTRSIRSELGLDLATVEVDDISSCAPAVARVFGKFSRQRRTGDRRPEYEYAVDGGVVHVSRVYTVSVSDELRRPVSQDVEDVNTGRTVVDLQIGRYGRLNTLAWTPRELRPLADDEVVVEARAGGMNFRDVLVAMGIVDSKFTSIGLEAAGIVRAVGPDVRELAPGDRVFAFGGGCFSTGLVISEKLCAKIPDALSFEEAATMPCVFSTVVHGLLDVARLAADDSVLIHSACGGVGLAAIQICKMVGAEVFCTVGSEEKIRYLGSTFGIPRDRIFNSRDASFLPDVLAATRGRGADVVLNSLSGELLHASWGCVAEFGKMIEIGKRDLIGNGRLALSGFLPNRSYHGVDLGHLIDVKPKEGNRLFKKIVELYEQGHITPIQPIKTFTAETVEECFRHMQKGQHIGKIVLKMDGLYETSATAQQQPVKPRFDPDASYLLVGGLGGLGRSLSNWMVEHGARHLVYLSRQGSDAAGSTLGFFAELEEQGCSAAAVQGTVTSAEDVRRAMEAAAAAGPLRGVVNMTMVLRDVGFAAMSHDDWTAAAAPKVRGTWNLHAAAADAGVDLDFFLLFGSVSGLVGQRGQANYAGANTFLDAFAQYRRGLGLSAAVVDVGAMVDHGHLADNPALLEKLVGQGVYGVRIPQLLDAVAAVLVDDRPAPLGGGLGSGFVSRSQLVLGHRSATSLSDPSNRVGWKDDRRMGVYHNSDGAAGAIVGDGAASGSSALAVFVKSAVVDPGVLSAPSVPGFLARQIAAQLFRLLLKPAEDEDEIDVQMTLQDAGLDSLVAVEMRSWWKGALGFDISVLEMLGMGSLSALGERAARGLRDALGDSTDANADDEDKHDTEGYLKLKMP